MGPPTVIEAGVLVPVKEPVPLPVQLVKWYPLDGVALIEIVTPLVFQPEAGLTDPPVLWPIVRKYWVLKFAV